MYGGSLFGSKVIPSNARDEFFYPHFIATIDTFSCIYSPPSLSTSITSNNRLSGRENLILV